MKGPEKEVERITVPDESLADWIKTLGKSGFNQAEIDVIMGGLNETYLEGKFGGFIDAIAKGVEAQAIRELGKLTDAQQEAVRQVARKRMLEVLRRYAERSLEE